MDQTQLQQNIAKYYANLPVNLQESFSSMEWMENLKNISTKYSLNSEQIETLATETTLLLLGIVHIEEYKNTIEMELRLQKEEFNKIYKEINDTILINISEKLEEVFISNAQLLSKAGGGGVNEGEEIKNKKTEDEVPLPPYAQKKMEQTVIIKEDARSETPKAIGESFQTKPESIFEEKLKGPTASEHTVSDYSVPKNNTIAPISEDKKIPSQDPYREAF